MSEQALLRLLRLLKERTYSFTAVTPATHARILARPCNKPGLRDIFGWNRPFTPADLAPELLECLRKSDALEEGQKKLRSKIRVASLGEDLFVHSAFPTSEADAVFFGPDTYRFVRFIKHELALATKSPSWLLDMGAGSGAGAIAAGKILPSARLTAVDINGGALEMARVNARAAGIKLETLNAPRIPAGPDLVIANPPYMMDSAKRAYRDGGDLLGGEVARDWVAQALESLAPGGKMLLYTGAAVTDGRIPLVAALLETCRPANVTLTLEEIDPDVFGEELGEPAYARVERIALLTAKILKK